MADPAIDGTRSEAFIVAHLGKGIVLIGGTSYAGEIKKSIFSIMNYVLPQRGVLSMHCSANEGPNGDAAVFFGLSGTGTGPYTHLRAHETPEQLVCRLLLENK